MKKKFCKGFLALTFTLLCLKIPAQQALKIGEILPESFWTTPLQVVNHPEKTITLDKDRGKLILLDFWATWCGTCLTNFPKMEALQKEFGDHLTVLPATDQARDFVEKFFTTNNGQRYKSVRSVVGAQFFKTLFPYKAVPYIVWIKDGQLLNATDAEQVTEENVRKVLAADASSLQTVLQVSRERPLMLAEQFDLEKGTALMNYVLFSKGRIRAIPPGSGFHREGTLVYGRQYANVSLLRMYRGIAYQLFEAEGQQFSDKRLVTLVKDPAAIDFAPSDSDAALDAKSYSLEFIVPRDKTNALYPEMLKAVNNYSGYTGSLEKQRRKCLVAKRNADAEKRPRQNTAKDAGRRARPLAQLIADLNDMPLTELAILDESGYTGGVSVDAADITSLEGLKKALAQEGFRLDEEERDLLMLVVRDR